MNEMTTLIGEVTVTVTDEAGRQKSESRHRNRVFSKGLAHIADCLAGLITLQKHYIEIGAGLDPENQSDLDNLLEAIDGQEVEEPIVEGNQLTFISVFRFTQVARVAESGLRFVFSRDDLESSLLYNRAEINPPVDLNVNDRLRVQWNVFFDWIQAS